MIMMRQNLRGSKKCTGVRLVITETVKGRDLVYIKFHMLCIGCRPKEYINGDTQTIDTDDQDFQEPARGMVTVHLM